MLMKVQLPVEASNAAIVDGALPKTIGKAMDDLKPEAAYFFVEGGKRSAIFVFDMADPSQIPVAAEPFFQGAAASVEITPVMTVEDLQTGLGQLQG